MPNELSLITQGTFEGYDYDRMVVRFTMMDDGVVVPCAISTIAMDDCSPSAPVRQIGGFHEGRISGSS